MTGVQTCALPICFPVTIGGVLLASGADHRHRDKNGWTPVAIARSLASSRMTAQKTRVVYEEILGLMTAETELIADEMQANLAESLTSELGSYSVSYVGYSEDPETGKNTLEVTIEEPEGVNWENVVAVINKVLESVEGLKGWKLLIPAKQNFVVRGNLSDLKRVFSDRDFPSVVVYLS